MRTVARTNNETALFIFAGQEFRNPGGSMSGVICPAWQLPIMRRGWMPNDERAAMIDTFDGSVENVLVLYSYDTPQAAISLASGKAWVTNARYSQTTGRHRSIFESAVRNYSPSQREYYAAQL